MRTLPKRFTTPDPEPIAAPVVASSSPVTTGTALPMGGGVGGDWPGHELLDSPMLARVLLAAWGGDAGVVVRACPGAGKSYLISRLAPALAHRVGLRVAVAAQTREQCAELARRIAAVSDRMSLIVSGAGKKPVVVDGIRTVAGRSVRWQYSTGGEILVGTAARWLYVDPNLAGADVLLVDLTDPRWTVCNVRRSTATRR